MIPIIYLAALSESETVKFEQIYNKNIRLMLYVANQILNDSMLAEDAVQDAFISLSMNMDKVEGANEEQTRGYLATIVKNKALDILRREKRRNEVNDGDDLLVRLDADDEDSSSGVSAFAGGIGEDPLDSLIKQDSIERIVACISRLDANSRILLEYKYLHQMKEKEIAAVMGETPKKVNVQIYRARVKLAKLLESEGLTYDNR